MLHSGQIHREDRAMLSSLDWEGTVQIKWRNPWQWIIVGNVFGEYPAHCMLQTAFDNFKKMVDAIQESSFLISKYWNVIVLYKEKKTMSRDLDWCWMMKIIVTWLGLMLNDEIDCHVIWMDVLVDKDNHHPRHWSDSQSRVERPFQQYFRAKQVLVV